MTKHERRISRVAFLFIAPITSIACGGPLDSPDGGSAGHPGGGFTAITDHSGGVISTTLPSGGSSSGGIGTTGSTVCDPSTITKAVGSWSRWSPSADAGFTQPPARGYHAMAYGNVDDAVTILLFGGGSINSGIMSDAWVFDPVAQTWAKTQSGPSGRGGSTLTYLNVPDADGGFDGEFVLFGGEANDGFLGDTWLYRGGTWTSICDGKSTACSCGPCNRGYHAAAFDSSRKQLVLFGGRNDDGSNADTWTFSNDGQWSPRCASACDGDAEPCCFPPSARSEHAMAFDMARGVVVLYGGKSANDSLLGDTWEWDGVHWLQRLSLHSPGVRAGHMMASGPHSKGVLLFGGIDSDYGAAKLLWYWDGNDWTTLDVQADSPESRAYGALAYDNAGSSIVLFGGGSIGNFGDTWSLSFTQRTVTECSSPTTDGGDASSVNNACNELSSCCSRIADAMQSQSCSLIVMQNTDEQCEQALLLLADAGKCN